MATKPLLYKPPTAREILTERMDTDTWYTYADLARWIDVREETVYAALTKMVLDDVAETRLHSLSKGRTRRLWRLFPPEDRRPMIAPADSTMDIKPLADVFGGYTYTTRVPRGATQHVFS